MAKQKPIKWSRLISGIGEAINKKIIISDEEWAALFGASHSVMSCKDALFWLGEQPDEKWTKAFYEKMQGLADSSFTHQRWLAQEALKQQDHAVAMIALDKMIEQAKKNSVVVWWDHILRLLPENDPKISLCKAQKKMTEERNQNFLS